MSELKIEQKKTAGGSSVDDEIICGCVNLRLQELQAVLDADPKLSFDELLGRTKAGGSCTSCLLDLEYYYVTLPRTRSGNLLELQVSKDEEPPWHKRWIYPVFDRLSGQVPFPLIEWMPVLVGSGIEQWVWVANQSLLYEGKECAPDFDIDLTVRDSEGGVRHHAVHDVKKNSALRLNVSQFLPPSGLGRNLSLGIGSVVISRRARQPGFRGTIRPQIQIISSAGSCAVHSQAPSFARPKRSDQHFTCLYRPQDERIFFSIVNASNQPLTWEMAYPFAVSGAEEIEPLRTAAVVPPYGSRLHEVHMPSPLRERCLGRMFSSYWNVDANYKMHVFCATPNLDRFSVDHL